LGSGMGQYPGDEEDEKVSGHHHQRYGDDDESDEDKAFHFTSISSSGEKQRS